MEDAGVDGGKRAVKALGGRIVGRGEGGRRKEVRIWDSVGGGMVIVCVCVCVCDSWEDLSKWLCG